MTPEQFVYWLQGLMEVQNPESLTKEQTQMVKDHLNEVLTKVTPGRQDLSPYLKKALKRALESIRKDEGHSHSDTRLYC